MVAYLIIDFLDGKRNALIADLCVKDDDGSLIAIVVSEAIKYSKNYPFHLLSSYSLERDGTLNRFFSFRNGFLTHTSKDRKLPQSRFLYYLLNEKLNSTILSDKNNWIINSVDTCFFW